MIDPAVHMVEDRGYGRGVGHCVLPSGQLLAVSHEEPNLEFNNELTRLAYADHQRVKSWERA